MGLKLITPPATMAVTLTEAKAHLRVAATDTDKDTIITAMTKAAIGKAESFMGRALINQTWDLYLDGFPTAEIQIPKPPLIEIVSVNYNDTGGVEQVFSSSGYYVDNASEPGWIVPQSNMSWPSTIDAINSVRIRFRAGYVDDVGSPIIGEVPFDIRAGILLILGSLFEYREEQVVGDTADKLPMGSEYLLRPHRVLLGMA